MEDVTEVHRISYIKGDVRPCKYIEEIFSAEENIFPPCDEFCILF